MGYAMKNGVAVCLDAGHFHPTEVISNKISSLLLFSNEMLLHVSRPVRWDSDHVVILDDELQEIAFEVVRNGLLPRVHIGLDFFDASINRVAAWVIGTRNMQKALLRALLEPTAQMKQLELDGDYTARLAYLEELKAMPWQGRVGGILPPPERARRPRLAGRSPCLREIHPRKPRLITGKEGKRHGSYSGSAFCARNVPHHRQHVPHGLGRAQRRQHQLDSWRRRPSRSIWTRTRVLRTLPLSFDASALAGRYLIVTGTGRYFRNVERCPQENMGVIRIAQDGRSYDILWGFEHGGKPTSELPTHLMNHIARLRVDPQHRIVMHCHPANILAMTYVHDLDDRAFTKTLWRMSTECIVVFPEGISVLPWMVCGTNEIGEATAEKIGDTRIVLWAAHGIFGAGRDMDEVFGLIETVEKAAEIYMKIGGREIRQSITDAELAALCKEFGLTPREGYLDL